MVRTTDRPSTAPQRRSRTNGNEAHDEKVQRGEHDRVDHDAEGRDQSLRIQSNGQDQPDDGREDHDASDKRERHAARHSNARDERGLGSVRDIRDSDESRNSDESRDSDESRNSDRSRGFGEGRDSRNSDAADMFAPVLRAYQQMYSPWFQLADSMAKAQQQALAQMIGGGGTRANDSSDGDRRGRELAVTASRTSSATAGRIEQDRR